MEKNVYGLPLSYWNDPKNFYSESSKVNLSNVFSAIEERVCQVHTLRGKCNGLLCGSNRVLVPFHALALKKIEQISETKDNYHIYSINVLCRGTYFNAQWASASLDVAVYYDCALFVITDNDFIPFEEQFPICEDPPKPGDKLYYACYPLIQTTPSFHKARVSSVDEIENPVGFHLDCTVMPGSSGGPVFALTDKGLKLIGMIFAQISNIDSGFIREKESIKSRLIKGGIIISGVDIPKVINSIIDTVFDNLAVGIGKVIRITTILKMIKEQQPPQEPSPFQVGFPLMKTEQLPGKLATEKEYAEWYHRRVKPNKTLCGKLFDRSLDAADQINKDEEKILRSYYEKNVLGKENKNFNSYAQTDLERFEILEDKINHAERKALKNNAQKSKWITILESLKLPDKKKR